MSYTPNNQKYLRDNCTLGAVLGFTTQLRKDSPCSQVVYSLVKELTIKISIIID